MTNQRNNETGIVSQKKHENGVVEAQLEMHSGPLPHPKVLAMYEEIVPGAADRILGKFEQQSEHRIRIENRLVWVASIKEIGGLLSAFIISVIAIGGGIYTALQGNPWFGSGVTLAGVALIVGIFMSQRLDKQEKD